PVTLTIINQYGCKNEIQKNIGIKKEDFQLDVISPQLEGCSPFKLKFSSQSNFTISQHQWSIAGTTSSRSADSIVIQQPGTYELVLQARDDKGCSQTVRKTVR